jgi:choline kinase
MKAILLAAGRGSRLGKYTVEQPKCLTELGGRSLIGRQIATLRDAGIDDIVLATGYRADMLDFDGIATSHNPEWATTNMVETLFCTASHFDEDIIVSYADIVYEPRVLEALLDSPHDISVIVDRQWRAYWEHRFEDPLADAESMVLDGAGRILTLGDPVEDIDEIQAQYIGLMRFRGDAIASLRTAYDGLGSTHRPWMDRRSVRQAYMTDLLMELILSGVHVHAIPVDGGWLEIDTESDFESADAMWRNHSIKRFFDPLAQSRATRD